jgi:multicomponent Na+:H+ antiporter subunit D
MVHHIIVKTALFLTGGLVEHAAGSSRLRRLGGMVRTTPVLAWLFLLPALSLVGIPPLSGFVSKLALVDAGMAVEEHVVVGVSLVVSFLTLLSMIRIWAGVFWNPPEEPAEGEVEPPPPPRLGGPLFMVLPTGVLVAASLGVAAWAGPLYDVSERTARDMLDRDRYVGEVLGQ